VSIACSPAKSRSIAPDAPATLNRYPCSDGSAGESISSPHDHASRERRTQEIVSEPSPPCAARRWAGDNGRIASPLAEWLTDGGLATSPGPCAVTVTSAPSISTGSAIVLIVRGSSRQKFAPAACGPIAH